MMDKVNQENNAQKLRGGYYTDPRIANFLCKWIIQADTKNALEPSCGDGVFIEAAGQRFKELGTKLREISLTGVELIEEEAKKAAKRATELGLSPKTIVNSDFFHFVQGNPAKKYDVVIGNPPFIRYQNFPEEHRKIAMELMRGLGFKPNRLTNIWVPFLVISASLLTEKGKLAMVIPAELFQVKYAAETRMFLAQFFERINIVTFQELVFEGVQQEVVLLLCEKSVDHGSGIRVIECENLDDLATLDFLAINGMKTKQVDHSSEKWTKYFLDEEEIVLLRELKLDKRILSCGDLFETQVGLVTGRNEFFMLTKADVDKWNLQEHTMPVISRSNHLRGITFTREDFQENARAQHKVYLFLPPEKDFKDLPKECQDYISYGEERGFHLGYKTRIRRHWYITPSRWVPDGFALRQVGIHPKIVVNDTMASSTDTVHRVRFKEGVNRELAAVCFLNSLTFAYSEVTGRSYGGGVLTFEPTEVGEIQIPSFDDFSMDLEQVELLMREGKIEKVLELVDEALLIDYHGFSRNEVEKLRRIWTKLSQRRINRR